MFVSIGTITKLPSMGIIDKLCKVVSKHNVLKNQTASLTRAIYRDEDEVPLVPPFPYHKKSYTNKITAIMDTGVNRMHKHSKIIVVDGQVASGKDKLAQQLAKEFDFLYLPQPSFDDLFLSPWGFDYRSLDSQLPKEIQTWDIERFLQDPYNKGNAAMQLDMFLLRNSVYVDALIHIILTGQGIVTVRSPWSDVGFAKAMYQSNYISKQAFSVVKNLYKESLHIRIPPHLIIYLDVPVDITLKNIKNHGEPSEKNAKAFTEKYLTDLDNNLKNDFLKPLKRECLTLTYDWSEGGDIDDVVDDIEALNFEDYFPSSPMFFGWRRIEQNCNWKAYARGCYTRSRGVAGTNLLMYSDELGYCKELMVSGEAHEKLYHLLQEIPDFQYSAGFNPLKGDKDYIWKGPHTPYITKDYVTPLIEKYNQRVAKLKEEK